MAKKIIMPKLDMTMEEGEISSWFVKEGDTVKKGEPLFEVLSEKAAIEVESTAKGTVLKILSEAGDVVPVAATVAVIGKAGEDYSEVLGGGAEPVVESAAQSVEEDQTVEEAKVAETIKEVSSRVESGGKIPSTPAAKTLASEKDVEMSAVKPNEEGVVRKQQVEDHLKIADEGDSRKMTPLARKMAQDLDVDVANIDSDRHRLYSDDIKMAIEGQTPVTAGKKLTGIRKISAQRLTEVWQSTPMVTSTVEVDVTGALELCQRLNEKITEDNVRINITDVLIKIMALALEKNPEANISVIGDDIIEHQSVNISVAVSIEGGLTVPVIRDANKKGFIEINKEKKRLAVLAKSGGLKPDDFKGGCMTISNIGMFGVDIFTPILNMPESSILGVGRIAKKPVVVDDEIVIRPMMWLSHTFDHRALDGVPAMRLLGTIRDMIEEPDLLLL